jgi:ribosomal protein L24
MAMIRPKGKAGKIAATVLKNKGVTVPESSGKKEKVKDKTPFLQH